MKNISRRKFIGDSVKGAAIVSASGALTSFSLYSGMEAKGRMPIRILGKTGLGVSVLAFGGGSQFQKNEDGMWEKMLEEAIENGINLFDTSPNYSDYKMSKDAVGPDERFARILSPVRDKVLISTKVETRNPKEVREELEGSLSRLNTDYIDILMVHSLNDQDNVDEIGKGIYREMQAIKKDGIARFIGFSSMSSAERSREMLEKFEVDVALLAFNPTQYGKYAEIALPAARKQNTGVLGMKVMRDLAGELATPGELYNYAMSLEGVSSIIVGHIGNKQLKENIHLAQEFETTEINPFDQQALEARLAPYAGPHRLCWARPGYTDGLVMS
jgi:aryl-alcohol dehydrogenase-like predicted oxidoreductase